MTRCAGLGPTAKTPRPAPRVEAPTVQLLGPGLSADTRARPAPHVDGVALTTVTPKPVKALPVRAPDGRVGPPRNGRDVRHPFDAVVTGVVIMTAGAEGHGPRPRASVAVTRRPRPRAAVRLPPVLLFRDAGAVLGRLAAVDLPEVAPRLAEPPAEPAPAWLSRRGCGALTLPCGQARAPTKGRSLVLGSIVPLAPGRLILSSARLA